MAQQSISASKFFCNAALYRIRVCGRLTADWSDRLQGMQIATIETQDHGSVTELSGVLADQAALMGVLMHLYECGIALISVTFGGFGSTDEQC